MFYSKLRRCECWEGLEKALAWDIVVTPHRLGVCRLEMALPRPKYTTVGPFFRKTRIVHMFQPTQKSWLTSVTFRGVQGVKKVKKICQFFWGFYHTHTKYISRKTRPKSPIQALSRGQSNLQRSQGCLCVFQNQKVTDSVRVSDIVMYWVVLNLCLENR